MTCSRAERTCFVHELGSRILGDFGLDIVFYQGLRDQFPENYDNTKRINQLRANQAPQKIGGPGHLLAIERG
jgi:hypothetical protein